MKKIIYYIKNPFSELKDTKALTLCSLLISLGVLTNALLTVYTSIVMKFSVSFLFTAIIAMKFGPIIAATSAAITDITQYLVRPMGAYLPLLTLTCFCSGIIYGIFLYKDKTAMWRIVAAKLATSVIISTLLDSYILSIYFPRVFRELLVSRGIKNTLMFPLEILLLVIVLNVSERINKKIK